jgi:thiol:disulfide interchange protein DsbD
VDWQWDIGFLNRPMVLSLWVVCSAFVCLYLLGLFRLPHDAPAEAVSVTRVTFSLVFGALALYLATGLGGRPLPYIDGFLPLAERPVLAAEGAGTLAEHRQWAEDMPFEEGMKTAQEQGKPLAVELTAFTCVNCRVMESTVLVDPEVVKEVGRFVSIRLYTDGNPPARAERNRRFQEAQFGSVALPFYALYDSHGNLVRTHQGVAGKAEFLEFLRAVR